MLLQPLRPCGAALVAVLLLIAGSLGDVAARQPAPTPEKATDADGQRRPSVAAANAVTLEGRLFFNDMRRDGNFKLRRYPDGSEGAKSASRDPGTSNFLAARAVVAEIYEVDDATFLNTRCQRLDLLGSVAVQSNGDFSFTTTHVDRCGQDSSTLRLAVQFRLRYCNGPGDDEPDRCFSVRTQGNDVYTVWHGQASESRPFLAAAGSHMLDDAFFQASPLNGDRADLTAQAANMYASLVDAVVIWHVDNPVPFYFEPYGEVTLHFPSTRPDKCKTYSTTEIHCRLVSEDGWVTGDAPAHEYGHVLQRRAWDGTTGPCGDCPGGLYERDGNESWSATTKEYPNAAFKEGWANLVQRVSHDTCAGHFDANGNSAVLPDTGGRTPIPPKDGKAYPRNVTKLLCDWFDEVADDDLARAGRGDHFRADLSSIWTNMKNMFTTATEAELEGGLNLCHYVWYYVNDRKGPGAVGRDEHDRYRALIADLAYQNGVACELPEPDAPDQPYGATAQIARWTIVQPDNPLSAPGRSSKVTVDVAWQDGSWNEDEFVIEASGAGVTSGSSWQTVGTAGPNRKRFVDEFSVGGWLPPLGERCYRVKARNAIGDSTTAGPPCMTLAVPTGPTGFAGWIRKRQVEDVPGGPVEIYEVHLSWTDRSDNETRFEVEKSSAGSPFELSGVTDPDEVATTLGGAPGTACYRVRARNPFGASSNSNEVCLTF